MTDEQLLRYSRHILLDDIGIEGQERLLAAHAVVVGAGGLGSPVALYLASAGVGRITLVDADTVDTTNLQRQIAHTLQRVGQPKVVSARQAMLAINPDVQVHTIQQRADAALLDTLVPDAQVVLDCTDNFATRHAINRACVRHRVPLVSGAAIRLDGQVAVYDPRQPTSPCYACLFPPEHAPEEVRCATMGVFAPLVGIIGTLQAAEAIKLLAGMGAALTGRLLMFDGRASQFTDVQLARRPDCPVCGDATRAR
ncbi:molybdopterin/thiamine biosynthesis adenylyltransferase [Tepidimonas ignava]|uniref:Molybdopterin-synthase adenylyltransferase n=1 Tax=Tepidimonas ignava TaxID=114249 RepID=A0A4R3LIZ9_9BURK|nr:molybdopterin-synthase adenylyltransferase MoeB [Tepidimonas ignava]TCS99740.1 molybdopterin/thiamine biosynthesis adenylyltransferase [Tepidimonas ignava]TSE23125.1 Molybdopterin-synthase adenylyltransferase [Tepidimonas ignava]